MSSPPPETALPSDAELAALQLAADPLADQAIAEILGPWPAQGADAGAPQWQRLATVNILLGQWTDNAAVAGWRAPLGPVQGMVSGAPAEGVVDAPMAEALDRYVAAARALPGWADMAQVERAEQLFMEHGALSCILLFCASLPECYVVPDLSSVLHTTGQLEQNTEYRIRSTAAMIFPVMLRGGLGPQGAGVAQTLKVRLIHATVRNLILRGSPQAAAEALRRGDSAWVPPAPGPLPAGRGGLFQALHARGWDTANDGLPCNQEELGYTLLTFGYVFLRSLRRLGIGLTARDEAAYLHAWNVAGHVLGIDRAVMVGTMDDGQRLMARMQARGRAHAFVPDPRPALGQALMHTMEKSLPWEIAKPFPRLMTRYLCGPETAGDLGLQGSTPWVSAVLFWGTLGLARLVDGVVRLFAPRFSITRALTRVLGYHFMSQVLMSQTRPLQLPAELLQQVDETVHHWSDDPHAPAWLNHLEDRLTTAGSWSAGLAQPASGGR